MIRWLMLVLLLCGCSGRSYLDSDYVASKFEQEKLAVVIFKMRGKSTWIGTAPKVTFDLVRINKELGIADGKHLYHSSPGFFGNINAWDKGYLYLMIDPGFYVIDNISWSQGNTTYYTPKGALPTSCPVQYGAFEVKPGTVSYLGDLEVFCHQAALGVHRVNRFDEAKAALEKNHPELAPYLMHTDFLPAGYCSFSKSPQQSPNL